MSSTAPRRALAGLSHPLLWGLLVVASTMTPLVVTPGDDPPLGRPWYVERLLGLALLLVALLVALGRHANATSARRRHALYPAVVALVAYGVFVANYATVTSGDNLPTRAIPRALLGGDGVDLSEVVPASLHSHYSVVKTEGGLSSAFPLGTALLATPYYWVARMIDPQFGSLVGPSESRLEKHIAALMSTLAVLLLYLASRTLLPSPELRLGTVLLGSLGSPVLLSVSQGLWSHTGEILCLAVAAWALSSGSRRGGALGAGLATGLAFLCRPTAVLVAPALVAFAPSTRLRALRPFLLSALGAIALVCAVNGAIFGHPLGSYGQLNSGSAAWDVHGYLLRLGGMLASPSRGLIWFFPALLVAVAGLASRLPTIAPEDRRKMLAAFVPVVAIPLMTASFRNWWGGYSVGPRLLAELVLPALVLVALALRRGVLRPVLAGVLVAQMLMYGVLFSSERAREWNGDVDVDRNPAVLYSFADSLLAAAFVPGWSYTPPPSVYVHEPPVEETSDRWLFPIDLSAVANADAGTGTADPAVPWGAHLELPRLDAEAVERGRDLGFRLVAGGRPNTVRICAGESIAVPLADLPRFRRVAAVLAWRGKRPPADPMVGILYLDRADGLEEVHGLRLGQEVFDPTKELEPPGYRILAGRWNDYDELVRTDFALRKRADYDRIRITVSAATAPGCLYVVALSVR